MGRNYRFTTEQAQRVIARIVTALEGGRKTREQVAAAAFLSVSAVSQYIRHLRKQKKVRIAGWGELSGRQRPALYGLGSARDTPKPKRKTPAQVSKGVRARVKTDPARAMHYRAKQVIRDHRRRGSKPVPSDPMLAWMPQRTQHAFREAE